MNEEASIKELDNLCDNAAEIRFEIEQMEELVKTRREKLEEINYKILNLLEVHDKTNWKTSKADFEVRERLSFKTPKTDEDKQKLFPWLQNKGIFWSMVNINSQTLNALCKSEIENCKQTGQEFKIPGIDETPTLSKQLIIKHKR